MSVGVVISDPTKFAAADGTVRPFSLDATGALRVTGAAGGSAQVGSTPLGYRQTTAGDLATSIPLPNMPADATVAVVIPDGAGVRLRKDGTAPTATVGMPVPVGGSVTLYGAEIAAARFIQQSAGAILNIEYAK